LDQNNDQKELSHQYCLEIDNYLKQIEPIVSKREEILNYTNRLTLASAILPIILSIITSAAIMLSEQYLIALINIANVLPPLLININKNKMNHYNDCTELKLQFTELKGYITRLAIIKELKDEKQQEIDERMKNFNEKLSKYLQINNN